MFERERKITTKNFAQFYQNILTESGGFVTLAVLDGFSVGK
jgi:hypothetical protein